MQDNFWAQFIALLPANPTVVGEVVSSVGELHTIELPDGALIRASSVTPYPDGTKVFVKASVIVGEAPTLTPVTINI